MQAAGVHARTVGNLMKKVDRAVPGEVMEGKGHLGAPPLALDQGGSDEQGQGGDPPAHRRRAEGPPG